MEKLWPPTDTIRVEIGEWSFADPRIVGTIDWALPFAPQTVTLTGYGAKYEVKLFLR